MGVNENIKRAMNELGEQRVQNEVLPGVDLTVEATVAELERRRGLIQDRLLEIDNDLARLRVERQTAMALIEGLTMALKPLLRFMPPEVEPAPEFEAQEYSSSEASGER